MDTDFQTKHGVAYPDSVFLSNRPATKPGLPQLRVPNILLYSPKGELLDTDTNLQRSIRLAKICHSLGVLPSDVELGEWRLPKFVVPFRPDFSRVDLSSRHPVTGSTWATRSGRLGQRLKKMLERGSESSLSTESLPAEVVAFLECSPRDPLAAEESSRRSTLNHNPAPPKVYLPIVSGACLHEKLFAPIDKRDAIKGFPGWCFGCRMEHGLVDWTHHPSYDPLRDRPVRVGGGYAYMLPGSEPGYMAAMKELMEEEQRKALSFHNRKNVADLPNRIYRTDYKPFHPKFKHRELPVTKSGPALSDNDSAEPLYRVPKAFVVSKSNKITPRAANPFSTDRNLAIPQNGPFLIKKSEAPLTRFVEVHVDDRPRKKYKGVDKKKKPRKERSKNLSPQNTNSPTFGINTTNESPGETLRSYPSLDAIEPEAVENTRPYKKASKQSLVDYVQPSDSGSLTEKLSKSIHFTVYTGLPHEDSMKQYCGVATNSQVLRFNPINEAQPEEILRPLRPLTSIEEEPELMMRSSEHTLADCAQPSQSLLYDIEDLLDNFSECTNLPQEEIIKVVVTPNLAPTSVASHHASPPSEVHKISPQPSDLVTPEQSIPSKSINSPPEPPYLPTPPPETLHGLKYFEPTPPLPVASVKESLSPLSTRPSTINSITSEVSIPEWQDHTTPHESLSVNRETTPELEELLSVAVVLSYPNPISPPATWSKPSTSTPVRSKSSISTDVVVEAIEVDEPEPIEEAEEKAAPEVPAELEEEVPAEEEPPSVLLEIISEVAVSNKSYSDADAGVEPAKPQSAVYGPLMEKTVELRWVVKPLEVHTLHEEFAPVEEWSPPVERQYDTCGLHSDNLLTDMPNNKVHGNIVVSKEFVPVFRIVREILESCLSNVMSQILKKKAPSKKEKRAGPKKVTKPVKLKSPIPEPELDPEPILDNAVQIRTPSPFPPISAESPREPTPPPELPTPPPVKPKTPEPRLPVELPPPRLPVELPPLPSIPVSPQAQKASVPSSKMNTTRALSSSSTLSVKKQPTFSLFSTSESSSFILTPTPPPSVSPEFEFDIKTRSPTNESIDMSIVNSSTVKPLIRHLTPKMGNNWTFRRELNVVLSATPPSANLEPKINPEPELPIIEELEKPPPTPEPEPIPIRRRERRVINQSFAKLRNLTRVSKKKPKSPALTKKELRHITDPLDYLAKYCLIHLDRLPVYERIFNETVSRQTPRFHNMMCYLTHNQDAEPEVALLNNEEAFLLQSSEHMRPTLRALAEVKPIPNKKILPAINQGEFHSGKVLFTIDQLSKKYDELIDEAENLEFQRDTRLAKLARTVFPVILDPYYDPKAKKQKKKKKIPGSKHQLKTSFTDAQVLECLNTKQLDTLKSDVDVHHLELKLNRVEEKIVGAEDRLDQLETERREMQLWGQEIYLTNRAETQRMPELRRKQSAMFNKLNPDDDPEMNLEDVEEALNQINGHLAVSSSEVNFILNILNIPGRTRINLKTFSCIAALSEKIAQLHPSIRNLINKFNFEALDLKMEKCKELFYILCDAPSKKEDDAFLDSSIPSDTISLHSLCIELIAGGLTEEHLDFVASKFARTNKNHVEYMDFLTYVPLFVELHSRICDNPLSTERVN